MPSVLVIDDEQGIRDLLHNAFERAGWQVQTAGESLDAIEAVMVRETRFDAIVTDVRMPGADGVSLLKALRDASLNNGAVIAVITGAATEEQEKQLATLLPNIFMRKPFLPARLVADVVYHHLTARPYIHDDASRKGKA